MVDKSTKLIKRASVATCNNCAKHLSSCWLTSVTKKFNFEIYIADRKATTCIYAKLFCSAVLTSQHYHWYAATRFAFPGGSLAE